MSSPGMSELETRIGHEVQGCEWGIDVIVFERDDRVLRERVWRRAGRHICVNRGVLLVFLARRDDVMLAFFTLALLGWGELVFKRGGRGMFERVGDSEAWQWHGRLVAHWLVIGLCQSFGEGRNPNVDSSTSPRGRRGGEEGLFGGYWRTAPGRRGWTAWTGISTLVAGTRTFGNLCGERRRSTRHGGF